MVCLESGTQIVIKAVQSKEAIATEYGVLIEDIRKLLFEREDWKIRFVHREANMVAHSLAKLALSIEKEKVWLEECPSQIFSSVLREKVCNEYSVLLE